MFALLPHRGRQRLAVDLAAGAQRQLCQRDELRRHHVRGQLLSQHGQEFGWVRTATVVTHQLRTNGVLVDQHQRLFHTLLCQQAGLYFLRLDAETTHLYLLVEATEVFQGL